MNKMFFSGALFNWSAALLFILAADWTLSLFGVTPLPTERVYLDFLAVLVAMFGVGYFWIALDPVTNRPIIKLGAIAKLVFVTAGVISVFLDNISWQILIPLAVDLAYSILFISYLQSHPTR